MKLVVKAQFIHYHMEKKGIITNQLLACHVIFKVCHEKSKNTI